MKHSGTLRERWGDEKYEAVLARQRVIEREVEDWRLTSDDDKITQGNVMAKALRDRASKISTKHGVNVDPGVNWPAWVCCHDLARSASHVEFMIRKKQLDNLVHAIRHAFNQHEKASEFLEEDK